MRVESESGQHNKCLYQVLVREREREKEKKKEREKKERREEEPRTTGGGGIKKQGLVLRLKRGSEGEKDRKK